MTVITGQESLSTSAEQRLTGLNLSLSALPGPFGTDAEAVQAGSLFFLSGMLPAKGRGAKFVGRVGAEFDVEVLVLAQRVAHRDFERGAVVLVHAREQRAVARCRA